MAEVIETKSRIIQERTEAYNSAFALKSEGKYTIKGIAKMLNVPFGTLCHWFYLGYHPLGASNRFNAGLSPELSYLLGAVLGDGCVYSRREKGFITFAVKDREFAVTFSDAISEVLQKKRNYKIQELKNGSYRIDACSYQLYLFLQKSIGELRPWIEVYPEAFLCGIYDAEGSISDNGRGYFVIRLSNTNKDIITLAKALLERLGFHPTQSFYPKHFGEYTLRINRQAEVKRFLREIGFTINRKQEKMGVD